MPKGNFAATLYPGSQLSIDTLPGGRHPTPGNVGICLCGGGSRALSAGMGQLRALHHLCSEDGVTLLSQTKAISTVSGGSWLGISYAYQQSVSDDVFLNRYIEDPADLTRTEIERLPNGNIGQQVTTGFSVVDIALQALFYYQFADTPADMLWQTVIGKHILSPYGLYRPAGGNAPTLAFSYDGAAVQNILNLPGQNPALVDTPFLTLSGNAVRPYFICNTAMFVQGAEPKLGDYQYLAPVQCTPFFTGIVGSPGGVDANGKRPGGGGVTSFAFNSVLNAIGQSTVTIGEQRPWSIMDSVGASSAAFAETLVNLFSQWQADPARLVQELQQRGGQTMRFIQDGMEAHQVAAANRWLEGLASIRMSGMDHAALLQSIAQHKLEKGDLSDSLSNIATKIVPQYSYWPVTDATPDPNIQPTRFADGGNLENTGVASLLSYSDIDNVIAFINSTTLLTPASANPPPAVTVDQTTQVITTQIDVDSQIPPLFGYQPYAAEDGTYTPYSGGSNISKKTAWGVHNQVFPSTAFAEFLSGIWNAAGGSSRPAIYKQELPVVANDWFGVAARENLVTCVWVYTSTVTEWECQLNRDVKTALDGLAKFPNYDTLNTELTPTEINLLASLTSWSVANDDNKNLFIDLYRDE